MYLHLEVESGDENPHEFWKDNSKTFVIWAFLLKLTCQVQRRVKCAC